MPRGTVVAILSLLLSTTALASCGGDQILDPARLPPSTLPALYEDCGDSWGGSTDGECGEPDCPDGCSETSFDGHVSWSPDFTTETMYREVYERAVAKGGACADIGRLGIRYLDENRLLEYSAEDNEFGHFILTPDRQDGAPAEIHINTGTDFYWDWERTLLHEAAHALDYSEAEADLLMDQCRSLE